MGRIGPIWIRLGSVLDLFWSEMDSCENRSGCDRPDMASGWIRSGFVLARHGLVREPIWIGAVRYGFGLAPLWICIDPMWIRARTYLDRIGPIWSRVGSVLGLHWSELDSCDTDMGRNGPLWIRLGSVLDLFGPTWIRVRTVLNQIGPIWIRIGSVLDLYWPDMGSCENRYGSERSDMGSDWFRSGYVLDQSIFARGPIWIGSVRHGFELARYAFSMGAFGVRMPLTLGMVFDHKYGSQ